MKTALVLLFLALSSSSLAASVTVRAFDLNFTMDTKAYELDIELEMACRYEKFVFSDSSEYEYTYKKVPLKITKRKVAGSLSEITVSNLKTRKHTMTGMFKSNKECQTYLNFFVKDKRYAVGWAGQFDRPIRLGIFEHSRLAEDKYFDIDKLRDQVEDKKVSFNYKPVGRQVNVRLAFDDISTTGMSTYLSQSVAADQKTGMPYLLQK